MKLLELHLLLFLSSVPEEFYKDKALYEDWDEIGDYFERHVCRPMENIMTGSDTRDKEFFVPENGGDDDE